MLARYAALDHDAYYTTDTATLERDKVFGRAWLYAGIAGDFSTAPRLIDAAGMAVAISHDGRDWAAQAGDRAAAIALCGTLVFVSLAPAPEPLAQYLKPFFEILETLSAPLTGSDQRLSRTIQANWKIMAENALDDYHTAAVHPKTLYPSMVVEGERRISLDRAGGHSLWRNRLNESDAAFWAKIAARLGTTNPDRPDDYQHLFIFPNFYLASFGGVAFILHRLDPIGADAVALRLELCLPLPQPTPARAALRRAVLADFVAKAEAVLQEDIEVCEASQRGRRFAIRRGLLGERERRIADFQAALLDSLDPESLT